MLLVKIFWRLPFVAVMNLDKCCNLQTRGVRISTPQQNCNHCMQSVGADDVARLRLPGASGREDLNKSPLVLLSDSAS